MIPIKFRNKNSVDILYNEMISVELIKKSSPKTLRRFGKIVEWCEINLGETFETIVKADLKRLKVIKEKFDKVSKKLGPQNKDFEDFKNFMTETLYKRKFPRKKFVEELQVTVCPYCNRNFVNSTYKRTICDLDHFYDKATYPIFAVSFYNLIPVCHSCNHIKASGKLSYSPHDPRKHTDDLLSFDFYIKGLDFLSDKKQLGIEINYNEDFENNVLNLKLNDVYQIHTDFVQEYIKKYMIFNPDYIEDLYEQNSSLFESREEIYRVVYGNYLEEKDYGKRPLSKLTKDIMEKLFFLLQE